MKKVINGKMYSTDTAEELDYCDNYNNSNLISTERLYRKKTGEYFLDIEGGNDIFSPKDHIIPDGNAGFYAKEWAGKNCTGEKYEEIFGKVQE